MDLTIKYVQKLKEKELIYKECQECDSGTVLLVDAIQILKQFEAELISQFLQTDITFKQD